MYKNALIAIFTFCLFQSNIYASGYKVIRDLEIEAFLYDMMEPIIMQNALMSDTRHERYTKNGFQEKQSPMYRPSWQVVSQRGAKAVPQYQLPKAPQLQKQYSAMTINTKKDLKNVKNIKFFLIDSKELNAFVSGGNNVYVNAGLIMAYDNTNLLRGVLAHELGHVFGSHLLRSRVSSAEANSKGLATMVLLSLGALATGGASTAGALIGSVAAGSGIASTGNMSYSRDYEREADSYGLRTLEATGFTASGLYDMMQYFSNISESSSASQLQEYFSTHPMPHQRLENIARFVNSEDKTRLIQDVNIEDRFQRVRAKISGYNHWSNDSLIQTKSSNMPSSLKKNSDLYSKYYQFYANLSSNSYQEVINIGKNLEYQKSDIYISEGVAQAYCALSDIQNAEIYFAKVGSAFKNNDIIDYEYGDCLVRFGKSDENIKKGISVLYKIALRNKSDTGIREMLVNIGKQKNNPGLVVFMQSEIHVINGNINPAKSLLENAINSDDYQNYEYKAQIQELYNSL